MKDAILIGAAVVACLPLIYLIVIACLSNGKRGAQSTIPPYPYPPRPTPLPYTPTKRGAQPKTDPDPARFAESVPTTHSPKPKTSIQRLTEANRSVKQSFENGEGVTIEQFRELSNAYGAYVNDTIA